MANETAAPADVTAADQNPGEANSDKITSDVCVIDPDKPASSVMAPVLISKPEGQEVLTVPVEPGRKYYFDFEKAEVEGFSAQDGNLILTFKNGGSIVMKNYGVAENSDVPPLLAFADEFSADELKGLVKFEPAEDELKKPQGEIRKSDTTHDIAKNLAQIEPAAGEGGAASGHGYGFQSDFEATPFSAPEDVGPINPTALLYGVNFPQDELFVLEESEPGPLPPLTPEIDAPDHIVFEDGSVALALSVTPDGSNSDMVITITGIPNSWAVSGPGTYDPVTETWTTSTSGGAAFTGGPILSPPADSDADLPGLVLTVTETNTSTGQDGTQSDTFDIITDAVADAPDLTAIDAVGKEGDILPVAISTAVTDTDGSEEIAVIIVRNVPAGFSLNNGMEVSPGVYELTPAELAGLEITPPAGFFGAVTLEIESVSEETSLTDNEVTLANNTAGTIEDVTLVWKPVVNPPNVLVNGGVDDALVKEDGAVDVPIVATLDPAGSGNETLTVTVTGIDPAWGAFSAPVGSYNPTTGTWTVTLAPGENLSTAFTFTPKPDSDIDLTGLVATATAFEPATATSASDTDGFNVIVDAVADVPDLDAAKAAGGNGTTIPLSITTGVNDTDGSEVIEVIKISNLPPGAALTAGTENGGVWSLTPGQLAGLGITVPNGVSGTFTLTIESVAFEQNLSGGEFDLTDNRASAFDTLTLCIKDDDIPVLGDDSKTVDETNLGPITVNGALPVDFFGDVPGTVTPAGPGSFNATGSVAGGTLTSKGDDVAVSVSGNQYVGTAGGRTVFTLTINNDGSYAFQLLDTLDHADGANPNDIIALAFGVTAEDSDGDTDGGIITINVKDDAPSISNKFRPVDETDLKDGPLVVTNTLAHDFGEDGPGTIRPTGNFTAMFQMGGPNVQLTSGGVDIIVSQVAGGYVGLAGGDTIFTLGVNPATGQYTYIQSGTIDHPGTTDPDDVIWLKFEVEIIDRDGDANTAIIGIDVHDDGPVADDDFNSFNASAGGTDGNVVNGLNGGPGADDKLSQDAPNHVTQIAFGAETKNIPEGGSVTIDGQYGQLEIFSDGTYNYTLSGTPDFGGTVYTYSIDNPPGGNAAGDIKNVSASFNPDTRAFTFSMTIENTAQGFTLAVNDGPNPKGHGGELALFYFDASGAQPRITVYNYNGLNTQTSWQDGSAAAGQQPADKIISSLATDNPFNAITVTTDGNGNKVFSFSLDASDVLSHDPLYGPDGEWTGVSFDNSLGIWLHPVSGLETSYGSDGFLTAWNIEAQSWFDAANQPTEIHEAGPECVQDVFTYTLTDADGDSDPAQLVIKTINDIADPLLIVGQNVDDDAGSAVPHLVGGGMGEIAGDSGNDILVGDAGGSMTIKQTQDYNITLMLDVSGSMGSKNDANSKISLLIDAVEHLFQDFSAYQDGEIKVHIVPFARESGTEGTFTLTNPGQLASAITFLNAMATGGTTNYEAALQSAIAWLEGPEPLDDAINTTYFISDGFPNTYLTNSGGVVTNVNSATAMAQITGSDGTNEVAQIQTLSDDVIAVGIDIGSSISNLHVIDSGGNALNIDDPQDLDAALQGTNPLNVLLAAGDDVLKGGQGDDIIFGDVLFTDGLAALHGLGIKPGAGWEAFERLESGESALNPGWSRADTIQYIRDNAESLSAESVDAQGAGRFGGNDTIRGGAGDDLIFGQEGDDLIIGGAGNDILYGGSGEDVFLFEAITDGLDTVKDFNAAEDLLDISALLTGYDSVQDSINDFVFKTESGGNTLISVDESGSGNIANATALALLEGVIGLNLEDITNNGQAVV